MGTNSELSHRPRAIGSRFTYSFGGNDYRDVQTPEDIKAYHMVVGEKYIIKVNPADPNRYIPIIWKPVFQDEATQVTRGDVSSIKRSTFDASAILFSRRKRLVSSDYEIYFDYIVDGVTYERSQYLPPDFDPGKSNIKFGDRFAVRYLVEDPRRAILELDNPWD